MSVVVLCCAFFSSSCMLYVTR